MADPTLTYRAPFPWPLLKVPSSVDLTTMTYFSNPKAQLNEWVEVFWKATQLKIDTTYSIDAYSEFTSDANPAENDYERVQGTYTGTTIYKIVDDAYLDARQRVAGVVWEAGNVVSGDDDLTLTVTNSGRTWRNAGNPHPFDDYSNTAVENVPGIIPRFFSANNDSLNGVMLSADLSQYLLFWLAAAGEFLNDISLALIESALQPSDAYPGTGMARDQIGTLTMGTHIAPIYGYNGPYNGSPVYNNNSYQNRTLDIVWTPLFT